MRKRIERTGKCDGKYREVKHQSTDLTGSFPKEQKKHTRRKLYTVADSKMKFSCIGVAMTSSNINCRSEELHD